MRFKTALYFEDPSDLPRFIWKRIFLKLKSKLLNN